MGQLNKLYETGVTRLNHELSLERMLNQFKEIRILLKEKELDDETRFTIQHSYKKVIDLEVSDTPQF